jgi:hypothetical protein
VLLRLEIDQAILFGILARVWGLIAGTVTILLITSHFSPEVQGYYYTFNQLLALKVFAELGLSTVIIQFASHEWSGLSLNKNGYIVGRADSLSRLASLGQFAFRWYSIAGVITTIGLSLAGYIFFSTSPDIGIDWIAPWLMLCLLTGLNLALAPFLAILEGCNQVRQVYFYQLVLAVLSNLAGWLSILSGANLWTAPIYSITGLIWEVFFLWIRYGKFFKSLLLAKTGSRIGWREIWPMQWRIAISWVSGYFIFSLFTPVMFQFQGPVMAGKMGMTLTLINALSAVSGTWLIAKAPRFGVLIAKQAYQQLDRLFLKATVVSTYVASFGGCFIFSCIYYLYSTHHPLSTRFLSPMPTALFLIALLLQHWISAMAVYLRAHKREPYMGLSVINGAATAISTLVLGRYFGALGMAAGYLGVTLIVFVIAAIIFCRCRNIWHS